MNILVLNCGSSSIKYAHFEDTKLQHRGIIERVQDFKTSIQTIIDFIGPVDAVGHRVVHGGESFRTSVLINTEVMNIIKSLIPLAPLHNRANLEGIMTVTSIYPEIPQIAVFDTAFHQSIPETAYRYALPEELYVKEKIRRYGFHGISHRFMLRSAAAYFKKAAEDLNLITFHLGNGDSVCAIRNGQSIDTSMGFTPLEGLIMGTRSGDIDPEIIIYLQRYKELQLDEIDHILNHESGLKGLCGLSDMRDIAAAAHRGDTQAKLAIDMFAYHAKKYLGSYFAVLGHVDGIVFSGGIGEHSALIRAKILEGLSHLGIEINSTKNNDELDEVHDISVQGSRIPVLVVQADEEMEIASETYMLVKQIS